MRLYVSSRPDSWLAENFVEWANASGAIEKPPDGRAWGAVLNRAARAGLIKKIGYAPANTSNRSPKCLWVKS